MQWRVSCLASLLFPRVVDSRWRIGTRRLCEGVASCSSSYPTWRRIQPDGINRPSAHMNKPSRPGEPSANGDVSALLRAWNDGDQGAMQALTPIVYDELHRLARHYMRRERPGHSLQATALVNEAYMRLAEYRRMHWQDRAHFFAVSAQVMRRILVEHARRHNIKRGGGVQHVSLDDAVVVGGGEQAETDLVALD